MEWSAKHGEFPAGDPELHHVIGTLFAEEGDVYDAERHLTLGTSDSAQVLSDLQYEWYASDEPSTAPHYAARAVFPYLLIGNTRAANKALLLFTSKLSSSHPGPRRSIHILALLGHQNLPFTPSPQLPRPAPPCYPTRLLRPLQAAQNTLRSALERSTVGRSYGASGRNVLWY